MAREGRVFSMVIEHELMHQETLLYMLQRLPLERKMRPAWLPPYVLGPGRPAGPVDIPAGPATLGARFDELPFGWDNEFSALDVHVPAFRVDGTAVTNGQFQAFVEDGGYQRADLWTDEDWCGAARRGRASRGVGAGGRSVDVSHPVRPASARASGRLAGLREPGGGARLRALARRSPAQ
jgi:formylglycine-generating enzyme required for sulfatase activity